DIRAGGRVTDGVPGWCHRDSRAFRQSPVLARFVPHVSCPTHQGWALRSRAITSTFDSTETTTGAGLDRDEAAGHDSNGANTTGSTPDDTRCLALVRCAHHRLRPSGPAFGKFTRCIGGLLPLVFPGAEHGLWVDWSPARWSYDGILYYREI